MDNNYKLINAVDPSKCRLKIRNKFAKLTLSSNKQKQADADIQQQLRENATLSNISRNLLKDLLTDDESEDEEIDNKQITENLLMRTNSTPSDDNTAGRKTSLQSANTTHCTEAEESAVMEALHVSETDNTQAEQSLDKAIERLSTRVSELTVEGPVTISSESSALELTQIVSTEHHKMVAGRMVSGATLTPTAKDEVDDSICISSGTEESAIIISDSSETEDELIANMTPSYCSLDHKTMDAAKNERMAKFLHDVKKNYGLPCTPDREFEDRCRQIAMADTEPMSSETLLQSIGPVRRTATADTNSMSQCENFSVAEREEAIQNTSRGYLAAADTEDMTKASETMMSSPRYEPVMKVGTEFLDDSVANPPESMPDDSLTIAGTSEEEEEAEPEVDAQKSHQALRESNSPSMVSKRSSSSSEQDSQIQINISAKINIKIQFSQQHEESVSSISSAPSSNSSRSMHESRDYGSAQKALPQPNALENIPHSPPERNVSLESQESPEKDVSQESSARNVSQEPPERDVSQDSPERDVSLESPERDVSQEEAKPESPEPDVKSPDDFEKAERLLNELYGNAWKTPEVLYTLKKSTRKKNVPKSSIKPQPVPFPKDESTLDDFSIFRQNIPQNLNSTRLGESSSVFKTPRAIGRGIGSTVKRLEVTFQDELPKRTVVKPKNDGDVGQELAVNADNDNECDSSVQSNESCKQSQSGFKTPLAAGRGPKSGNEEDSDSEAELLKSAAKTVRQRAAVIVDSESEEEKENISADSNKSYKKSQAEAETPKAAGRRPRRVVKPIEVDSEEEPSKAIVFKTKSGREVTRRLPIIVDSDIESEGDNASVESNESWKKSEDEDDDIENKPVRKPKRTRRKNYTSRSTSGDDLVYLDLTKDEIEIQHNISASPPANHDALFSRRLDEILKTCKAKDKPKIEYTPQGKPKRKLFTANINDDDELAPPPFDSPKERLQNLLDDNASVSLRGGPLPAKFEPFNKHLESVKAGKPIFAIQTPKSKQNAPKLDSPAPKTDSPAPKTPKSVLKESRAAGDVCVTPKDTYSFLKSLDLCVGKSFCHPDALYYRDNYRLKKDELATKLFEIYNKKCFNGELDVPLKWNKKLTNTAGRCMNKKRLGQRICVIELSEKVLTSADRLRCTLIHELCHAATWVFNGEGGHGASWKAWARKANQIFPELPKIGVCHQYNIEYKYTYKCTLCGAKSHAHSKSKKVENIRCSYCHGAIEIFLNKKDKEGNVVPTPVKEPGGFAKFVKEKYKTYKTPDLKHADVMKLLSSEFAAMKMDAAA